MTMTTCPALAYAADHHWEITIIAHAVGVLDVLNHFAFALASHLLALPHRVLYALLLSSGCLGKARSAF